MKIYLYFFLFLLVSCEIKSDQTVPVSSTPTVQNSIVEPPKSVNKYIFVVLTTKEPKLSYIEPTYFGGTSYDEMASTKWEDALYCSDIQEAIDFTEDDGYMLVDNFKKGLISKSTQYYYDVMSKVKDYSKREALKNEKIKILSSKYLDFNTYKEASIQREKILNDGE